jgi:hypothetical protein
MSSPLHAVLLCNGQHNRQWSTHCSSAFSWIAAPDVSNLGAQYLLNTVSRMPTYAWCQ